ncbi:N-acetylmuramoyl-L-alanine amidase [Pseudoalteromonas porphyrae]|uniref:N-acetylmuramoyl-L-alanine amidase AmiC n=2 Tax=Pseudoalteromonas TaxID=53246 RepID=A0A0N1MWJ8_9GAMM|nr:MULTISPECIES: N-acetylmuramoyl-L-alanine amidase [Pseudoalteromonas]KPH65227.1 N-acetylmuramoyl-L-alanine amidase [Pseudoalteromonas porphyrae]KPH95295.1 N-acetylmuramoyl-L-alanine amidase [Pseudoalteromonas porphyrae]NMR27783.1 AMIN domain-containing protein [Pseudoalteromonas sp. NEC-BIFX-2020_015]NNG44062.1 AMIN domain-containing protein [Pseudoalteromonas sp. NEC-BIFX-2020_002]
MSQTIIKWMCTLLLLVVSSHLYAKNTINSVRVWPSPDSTRVVFDLTDKPEFSYFMLKNPLRLVVDLEDTNKIKYLPSIPKKHQIVSKLRYSKAKNKHGVRLVFELTGAVKPVIFALAPTGPYKNRLVVDLYDKEQAQPNTSNGNSTVKKRELKQQRDIVIAIDAGHGGEDPGSIGPSGTYEKTITLQIAKRLERMIDGERGMISRMVRSGDYFVKLNTRTSRARAKKADFFVSIHADAFTSPQPSGASVWVLSLRRANSETAKWIEDKEKHSELLGGAADVIKDTASEKYLAQALLDMSMDHSMKTGFNVAEEMVQELKKVAKLHKKEPQAASLGVLKSPDIPSILVETGFISNPREEKLLKSANHQERLAKAIFTAIKSYYLKNPPDDSLFASLKSKYPTKHKVRPGESLSLLASRYGVSIGKLKQVNKLKSNTLFIGQELDIPQS